MKKYLIIVSMILGLVSCSSYVDDNVSTLESSRDETNVNFISKSDALNSAQIVYNAIYGETRSNNEVVRLDLVKLQSRTSGDGNAPLGFYIVNYSDGFALLSADRRYPPVYGISNTGSFNISDTTENKALAVYLENVSNIQSLEIGGGISFPKDSIEDPDPLPGQISRLLLKELAPQVSGLAQNIHQGDPWNTYCLTYLGKKAKTGSSPVSVAQVLSVNKYPKTYQGYTFNWDSNIDILNWARILEILGRPENCNVSYGEGSTKSNWTGIYNALSKMGYFTSDAELDDNSIKNVYDRLKIQMILGGYNNKILNTWVADGMKYYKAFDDSKSWNELYLHCLWGNGGKADGYFLFDKNQMGGNAFISDKTPAESEGVYTGIKGVWVYL